jgi:hypothetical protein
MEMEERLQNIDTNVQELTISMEKHISLSEGLDLPNRMTKAETNIENKPSWGGISASIGGLSLVVGMIYTVIKGI